MDFIFVATLYDNFERCYSQKKQFWSFNIWWPWPPVKVTQILISLSLWIMSNHCITF